MSLFAMDIIIEAVFLTRYNMLNKKRNQGSIQEPKIS